MLHDFWQETQDTSNQPQGLMLTATETEMVVDSPMGVGKSPSKGKRGGRLSGGITQSSAGWPDYG